jgi:hypothetical protein
MTNPAPVTFTGRLWRFTKRLTLFATMSAIAVGAAGYFGLPVLARQPWAVRKTEKALTKALGTPIQVGDMRWSWKDGLLLRQVSSPEDFRAESIQIKPRYGKLACGKSRATVVVTAPEVTLDETAGTPTAVRFPRVSKCGLKFEKIEVRDATYVVKSASSSRKVKIEQISLQGTGRLEKRSFRMDLESVRGSLDGMAFTGKGTLRVTPEGLAGELDVNDPAKDSATLRDALRAAHVTIKKAPVLSEPF